MDRHHAAGLLVHYFQLIAEAAGVRLDGYCIAEIESIAEAIYRDAVDTARRDIAAAMASRGGSNHE